MRCASFCIAFVVAATYLASGCERRSVVEPPPIQQDTYDLIAMVLIDTSGSFSDRLQKKAYPFFMAVIDKMFRNRIGSNDRLILAQISGTKQALFWDGHPKSLRIDYPDAKRFTNFLMSRPDPGGSRVYDSMADALEYLTTYPGVPEKKTKTAVLCLTDMDDNHPDSEKSKARLLKALADYAKVDGCLGIYWCDSPAVPTWRAYLRQAGIKNCVVEPDIKTDPVLPTFE